MLSFECYAILQTFECRGSLLWTVADKLFILSSKSVLMDVKTVLSVTCPHTYLHRSGTRRLHVNEKLFCELHLDSIRSLFVCLNAIKRTQL